MPKGQRGGKRGGATGGIGLNINPPQTTSLVSARDRHQEAVDQVLNVLRDFSNAFGLSVADALISDVGGGTLAYYDINGNIALAEKFFKAEAMDKIYDRCVKSGFHPARGQKTGLEAVTAHEFGHLLTHEAVRRAGTTDKLGSWMGLDSVARQICEKAAGTVHQTGKQMSANISGYATESYAECIAEAVADWYCYRAGAKNESKAVFNALQDALRIRR